jgi:hypothetical protein
VGALKRILSLGFTLTLVFLISTVVWGAVHSYNRFFPSSCLDATCILHNQNIKEGVPFAFFILFQYFLANNPLHFPRPYAKIILAREIPFCAEVAELADAADSKSAAPKACRFESGLRHQDF